jgi:hypothetical protein
MKKTLESFIDPKNIPKKYGGELEFQFGDMPNLDPYVENVIQWEGDRKDFPDGPIYWEKKTKDGKKIKAIATGSFAEGGKERHDEICVVTNNLPDIQPTPETIEEEKSSTDTPRLLRPELLTAPTETDLPQSASDIVVPEGASESHFQALDGTATPDGPVDVQDGELVPPSRPEPKTFITASEGGPEIKDLSLEEKATPNGSATGGYQTKAGALLDPNVKPAA